MDNEITEFRNKIAEMCKECEKKSIPTRLHLTRDAEVDLNRDASSYFSGRLLEEVNSLGVRKALLLHGITEILKFSERPLTIIYDSPEFKVD